MPLRAHRLRSRLRIAQLKLYGLAFGPVDLDIESRQGEVRLGRRVGIPVLDGKLWIESLRAYDLGGPFGPVPVLTADISVRDLDLEALTGTFSFGKIEGRLGGRVRRLRLEERGTIDPSPGGR